MKTRSVNIAWHIAGCLALLGLPILLSPHPPEERSYLLSLPTIRDFIANVLMLVFFYLNYFILIPRVYQRRHPVYYFTIVLAALLIIGSAPSLFTGRLGNGNGIAAMGQGPEGQHEYMGQPESQYLPMGPPDRQGPPVGPTGRQVSRFDDGNNDGLNFLTEIKHHVYLFFSVVLFSLLLAARNQWYKSETARQAAELAYLKSQINPHFLFNTLNNIYSLALRKDDQTADAVIQLSELMRYIIRDAKDNMVLLAKELQYIDNYIALQKSRLGASVSISYNQAGSAGGLQVAPLILISFIENAFKHGVNPDETSRINIQITVARNDVAMLVENAKVTRAFRDDEGSGVGQQNAIERLRLLYPDNHKLTITNRTDTYSVHLVMQL